MNEHVQTGAGEPLFNPLAPEFIRNPYPHYERMRTTDPMHLTPLGMYVASRHAEVSLVMRDKRFGKDFVERTIRRYGPEYHGRAGLPQHEPLDAAAGSARPHPPARPRGARPSPPAGSRTCVRASSRSSMKLSIASIPQGQMDLIEDFAFRLPVTIICDMLGIPEEHREVILCRLARRRTLARSGAAVARGNPAGQCRQRDGRDVFPAAVRVAGENSPGDDLTTQLVQAEEDGSKLSNEELTANIILLFGAGHETTVNLIGNGLLALHRNPDQLALLKANPGLITNAIEEFLRYDSSVQLTGRVALEDIEDLGGRQIPKGESVLCLLGSANHDPAVYPDRPERLDITRPNVKPLSFGGGIHFCLGAQLARIEAEIAISTLLRRLPDLRLDDAENPEWRPTFVLRGLKRLPASW